MSEQRTDGVGGSPTAQPQGVGRQEPTTPLQGVGPEQPTAEGAVPQGPPPEERTPINLDDLEDFRRWKSAYDKRMSSLETRTQEAEDRATQAASELDELRVRDMPSDEQAAFYRTRLAQERANFQQRQEESQQQQVLANEATALLEKLGIPPNTPGLEWGDKPSPENLAKLAASAALIIAERTRQQSQDTQHKTEEQVREARIGALNEAGVTRTGTTPGGAPPEPNPIADITDASELLQMGIEAAEGAGGRPRG